MYLPINSKPMIERKLKLAVLGSPIVHSRSPELHYHFAKCCGFSCSDFSYERICVTEPELADRVKRLISLGYDGFNCTMPLKTEISHLAHYIGEEAKLLSSANTVVIKDGKLYAHTTDGIGVSMAVRRGYMQKGEGGNSAAGKKVLLLGAGGAARSAALALQREGAEILLCNRTLGSAKALSAMLCSDIPCTTFEDRQSLHAFAASADILINCTSLGMAGKENFSDFDFLSYMKRGSIVLDAVYNPLETELLTRASKMGLCTVSGLWMLIYQGAAAFEKWTGIMPGEDICEGAFEVIKS